MGHDQSKAEQLLLPRPGIIIPKSTRQAMTDLKLGYVYLGSIGHYIGGGRWKTYEVGLYAPYVLEWNVKKGLVLDTNYQPYIFTQIIDIRFSNLLQLSLRQNNIESIEILSKLDAPKLQKLFMCQNNISSIRTIRRFYCPNLIYLSFNGNQNLQTTNFAYLDTEVLQQLFLHIKQGSFISLNYLAKLKSKNFIKVWLGRYNQDKQKNCFKTISKKYKKMEMSQFVRQCQAEVRGRY